VLAAVVLAVDELEAGDTTGTVRRTRRPAATAPSNRSRRARARSSAGGSRSVTARRRAVSRVMREVAEYLGNTPAVAKASYVDPRVVDLFSDGITIAATLAELGGAPDPEDQRTQWAVEASVLEMLRTGDEPEPVRDEPAVAGGSPSHRDRPRPRLARR
jgi:hypothetical protein